MEQIVYWQSGKGDLFLNPSSVVRGTAAWGKRGIAVSAMGALLVSSYLGNLYDDNVVVITPNDDQDLGAIWAYCSSENYSKDVREIDKALKVRGPLVKVGFDADKWRSEAKARFPNGVPAPYSDDPTQWIFHGHPRQATDPLQVTLSRLLGYSWPSEINLKMGLSEEAETFTALCSNMRILVDEDGIVPIPAMRGEQPCSDRLRQMLAAGYATEWSTAKEQELLNSAGYGGKSLDTWLRDGFFDQHCKLFQQRPFIWQVWDGLRDGFSVLVNYHKLGRKGLESLTYSYLGDWITRQTEAATRSESGAQGKLEKALDLQKKLVAILEGESPYDIFVRWKPLEQQPIGWEPDLNDGVRLNIRPFMTAGVLRKDPKLNWNKDRGKDVESAPWFKVFDGDRINDHHLSLEEKRRARGAHDR